MDNVSIVETGNAVEAAEAAWGLCVCGEFAICLCDNEVFDTGNDRRWRPINRRYLVAREYPHGHAVLLLPPGSNAALNQLTGAFSVPI
jgi:hypothetical protein